LITGLSTAITAFALEPRSARISASSILVREVKAILPSIPAVFRPALSCVAWRTHQRVAPTAQHQLLKVDRAVLAVIVYLAQAGCSWWKEDLTGPHPEPRREIDALRATVGDGRLRSEKELPPA
jgi:hypothetical protein